MVKGLATVIYHVPDLGSFRGGIEHEAYISLETGTIYWVSEEDSLEEEVPDDLGEPTRYIAIPHKNDLDLGTDLALRFVAQELPKCYSRVEGFFRHPRAYAHFKELLATEGCLDKWYAFEAESTERALRKWARENDIRIVRERQSANGLTGECDR